jgi:UDP-N-acetylmuramate--alanine ligase
MEGVTSEIIHKNITSSEKYLTTKDDLLPLLKTLDPKIILTIGAGDIDTLIPSIKTTLEP